ncbi:hypothetical protein OsI_01865 [Oryza sativa Indica Group]|uniref:Thiamin pyrophosphokinase catalytic domain-containing protein n=1 Tax=Oryza sativa subsp. indica TaxID=39946 RepID=A2WPT5_ORYSI|nr:hypothetical protein OsI_01865 [Oryza sativa Indica Group]
MEVMVHSSTFLLPKLHQPANSPAKKAAKLRICADGGANRIFDEMFQMTNDPDYESTRKRYIPEIIEGDMDSIRPEVKQFYSSQLCVLVTGALGGRFDHEAANINILYLFSDMRIVLLSDDCLIRLLPKTHKHEIYIESSVEGPHCGLFPVEHHLEALQPLA